MSTTTTTPPAAPKEGGSDVQALRALAARMTALAARGPMGPCTVLAFTVQLHRLATSLAVAEETLDALVDEAREIAHEERAGHRAHIAAFLAAQAAGTVVILDEHRRPGRHQPERVA